MKVIAASIVGLLIAQPTFAQIVDSASGGFASRHTAVVEADRATVWNELLHPERWWTHTWSDNANNLRLEATAGGCFCEVLPASDGWPAGSVEHMRVVFVQPGTTLRMSGSLGPLQGEGLAGTLTVSLEELENGGTRITWSYITGGQAHFDLDEVAPVVDRVQGEFLAGLVDAVGGTLVDD